MQWFQVEDAKTIPISSVICGKLPTTNNRKLTNDFSKKLIVLTFKWSWLIWTNRWHYILSAKYVRRTYINGLEILELYFNLTFWWFGTSHKILNDCYFSVIKHCWLHQEETKICDLSLALAIWPVPHFDEILFLSSKALHPVTLGEIDHDDANFIDMGENENDFERLSSKPIMFDQGELSDLIRDLSLSTESVELLTSKLKAKIFP